MIIDSLPDGRSFSVTSGGFLRGSGFISPFGFGGSWPLISIGGCLSVTRFGGPKDMLINKIKLKYYEAL